MDENGAFTNAEFGKFIAELPYAQARKLLETDDVSEAIEVMTLFKNSQNGGGSPSKDADPNPGGDNEPDKETAARQELPNLRPRTRSRPAGAR